MDTFGSRLQALEKLFVRDNEPRLYCSDEFPTWQMELPFEVVDCTVELLNEIVRAVRPQLTADELQGERKSASQ
jgi:hypothetical protein